MLLSLEISTEPASSEILNGRGGGHAGRPAREAGEGGRLTWAGRPRTAGWPVSSCHAVHTGGFESEGTAEHQMVTVRLRKGH